MSDKKTRTWEIRISTGDTTSGQVGLAFSFHMEADEEPANDAILKEAQDHLGHFDQLGLDGNGAFDCVLFTNSDNLKVDGITEIGEVDDQDEVDGIATYVILSPDGIAWPETENASDAAAWDLFDSEVLPKYVAQGYYGTATGEKIPVAEIKERCKCEQLEAEEEAQDPTGIATEATEQQVG